MDHITPLVAVVIATALAFDFTNGFHDTANAMAAPIATGALRPRAAVLLSGVLNLAGAFLSVQVAKTISGGVIDEKAGVRPAVVFAALVGAILWNLVTWLRGLPSSSSHALYGGLIGAVVVGAGIHAVDFGVVMTKIAIPALASPLVAGIAAWLSVRLANRITRRVDPDSASRGYKAGQTAAACLVSVAHGTSDGQKTMGVITLTLIAAGALRPGSAPPIWVIAAAAAAIGLGTACGGWRIIRTVGFDITRVEPLTGLAAQSAAASVILTSAHLGFGLSTTHVCTGGVAGAGLGAPGGRVQWPTLRRMGLAWVLTVPGAGLLAAAACAASDQGTAGITAVAAVAVLAGLAAYLLARRSRRAEVATEAAAGSAAGSTDAPAIQAARESGSVDSSSVDSSSVDSSSVDSSSVDSSPIDSSSVDSGSVDSGSVSTAAAA